jgi:hypothetical protein
MDLRKKEKSMTETALRSSLGLAAAVLFGLTFIGCGSEASVNGTYIHTDSGVARFELNSGKAVFHVFAMTAEGTYKVSGRSVDIEVEWNEQAFGPKKKDKYSFACTRETDDSLSCRDEVGDVTKFEKTK